MERLLQHRRARADLLGRQVAAADPELARIGGLGRDHMGDDLVPVPAPAAWALSELGRRRRHDPVEVRPAGTDKIGDPPGLLARQRPAVGLGDRGGDAEVGGGVATDALHDLEPGSS